MKQRVTYFYEKLLRTLIKYMVIKASFATKAANECTQLINPRHSVGVQRPHGNDKHLRATVFTMSCV